MVFTNTLRITLAVLLFASATRPARALQLGETKEQIHARHGAPGAEDRGKNVAIYFWAGWSAELDFQEETVRKLVYRRDSYLQASEIVSLLQANGGVGRWRETTQAKDPTRQWRRDDGAVASCLAVRPLMMTFELQKAPPAMVPSPTLRDAPKVMVPAVPPVSSTPPSFPKLLGSDPEPILSEEAPSVPAPAPLAELRPLPKLKVAEVAPVSDAPNVEPASEPEGTQPPAVPVVLPGPEGSANQASAKGYGLIIGLLAAALAVGGGAVYYFKTKGRRGAVKEVRSRIVAPRREMAETVPVATPALDALRNDQFELLVGEIFRREGYAVELSAAAAQGDSIDLTLRRDAETILVQCKYWRTSRVTEREVREFYGAMMANGAPRGIFVTAGSFSRDAQEFAEGKQIDLMDRAALEESTAAVARPGENFCGIKEWVGEFTAHARVFDPECPICQGTMVIRHNRANGVATWCCRNHPRCPGRREPRLDLLAAA